MTNEQYEIYKPLLKGEISDIKGVKKEDLEFLFTPKPPKYLKNNFNIPEYDSKLTYSTFAHKT